MKLALKDIKVGWSHEAVVYDEKPLQLATSMKQRQRWMQGLADVASHYVKPLVKKSIKEKSADAFHMLMNFFGDTLYPLTAVFFSVVYIMIFAVNKNTLCFEIFCSLWTEPWKFLMLSVLVWGNVFVILAGLYNDGKLDKNVVKNAWGFCVYLATWVPIGIWGILKKDEKEWFHTPHSGKDNR